MTKHRSHSVALERQVGEEFLGGETLDGCRSGTTSRGTSARKGGFAACLDPYGGRGAGRTDTAQAGRGRRMY